MSRVFIPSSRVSIPNAVISACATLSEVGTQSSGRYLTLSELRPRLESEERPRKETSPTKQHASKRPSESKRMVQTEKTAGLPKSSTSWQKAEANSDGSIDFNKGIVLVSQGFQSNLPQTQWLKTKVKEVRSQKSICWEI